MSLTPLYSLQDISIPTEFLIDDINDINSQDILIRPRSFYIFLD